MVEFTFWVYLFDFRYNFYYNFKLLFVLFIFYGNYFGLVLSCSGFFFLGFMVGLFFFYG